MVDVPEDPKAVLDAAIANEIESHAILQRGEAAANDPLARATFEFLAEEELKHIEIIKRFAWSIDLDADWDPASLEGIHLPDAARKIRGIFERFGTQFEEVAATDDERLEVYKVALDMERTGYDFYSKAAESAKDERAHKLFQFLGGEEQTHYRMIQDTRDFLDNPDAILAVEERWMQT